MKFKNTSDHIEAYIKAILEQSGIVELQRSQLADTFQVVPSQINYVIKTLLQRVEDIQLRVNVVVEAIFALVELNSLTIMICSAICCIQWMMR